jgi:putative FmdB family regulatory protein
MPIYAYRCEACGHAKDVLQKVSDPLLTVCPACGEPAFRKQLTAAGFQLKGSGWYVTDFKGGNNAAKPEAKPADAGADAAKPATTPSPEAGGGAPATTPAAAAPAPAAAPSSGPAAKPSTPPSGSAH